MANRPKGYGMTREISDRLAGKYDDELEPVIVQWICSITGESAPPAGRDNFHEWLKDGQVLCRLYNNFGVGNEIRTINDPNKIKLTAMRNAKSNENIGTFLSRITALKGVRSNDVFQSVDLFEAGNLSQVQTTLQMVSSAVNGINSKIPNIGAKIADKNVRHFDEASQREGRNVISLQMGTNQVASQQGMTAYGLGRQIVNNN